MPSGIATLYALWVSTFILASPIIRELNRLMPRVLDKTTEEYEAIFGKEDFTSFNPVTESEDFQCGAVCNELEYAKGFLDYVSRTTDVNDYYGDYLEKVLYFFTGLWRLSGETDTQLRNRFRALVIRYNDPAWITKWMIRDVFRYFFDVGIIYVIENYVLDTLVTDGSFEIDPAANWDDAEEGSSTVTYPTYEHQFDGSACAKMHVDASASAVSSWTIGQRPPRIFSR
jgi:hypothetical protein